MRHISDMTRVLEVAGSSNDVRVREQSEMKTESRDEDSRVR